MNRIEIRPFCRAEQPGSTATFKVRVDGGDGTTLAVRPCDEAAGYRAYFAGGATVVPADGQAQMLTVEVPPRAPVA